MRIAHSIPGVAAAALALSCFVVTCIAQMSEFVPPPLERLIVPAGEAEVSLQLETRVPLKEGDEIILMCQRTALPLRIVLPNGIQFDRTTASDHGFFWDYLPFEPPIGKSDGGERIRIEARKDHPAGTYIVRVSGPRPATEIQGALFIYPPPPAPELLHEMLVKSLPEARYLSPVTVPPRTKDYILPIEVGRDAEDGVLFQVVVPDRTVKVRLETPDGTIYDETMPEGEMQRWTVEDGPETDKDPDPWNLFDFTILLFPQQGVHHSISFPRASKGTYRIHLDTPSSAEPALVHAMYMPWRQVLTAFLDEIDQSFKPPADRVSLAIKASRDEAHVGDEITLTVDFLGPPVSEPIRFEIDVETRMITKPSGPGPREFGEPIVERPELEFRKVNAQRYEATYIAVEPGVLRFAVRARGAKADGEPFEAYRVSYGPVVEVLSSKLVEILEHAVDEDADGYPDRLEVRAELDVDIGGEYELQVQFQESSPERPVWNSLIATGKAHLRPGRRTLTASISSGKILEWARNDGPYHAKRISISRLNGNFAVDSVDTKGAALITKAYRRADWAGASGRASRQFEWRAADRLGSGKAQVLEIDWPIVSPGGRCKWAGTFVRLTGDGSFDLRVTEATLPEGKVMLPFDVLANRLLPYGSSTWRFQPSLECESSDTDVAVPIDAAPRIPFNAAASEPLRRGALMRRMSPVTVRAGQPVHVSVRFEVGAEPLTSGRLTIEAAPATFDCVVDDRMLLAPEPLESSARLIVTPKPDTLPGEYEIVLALNAGGVKTKMPLRVIVAAQTPRLSVQR